MGGHKSGTLLYLGMAITIVWDLKKEDPEDNRVKDNHGEKLIFLLYNTPLSIQGQGGLLRCHKDHNDCNRKRYEHAQADDDDAQSDAKKI